MNALYKFRVAIVTLLFAILGFILPAILKIDELKWYYYSLAPLLALLVSFLISFLLKTKWSEAFRNKLKWVVALLFIILLATLFFHISLYRRATFGYSDFDGNIKTYVKGNTYTPVALQYKKDHPHLATNDTALLYDAFGGPEGKSEAWTQASIDSNILWLVTSLAVVVIMLAALVSLLMETSFEKVNRKRAIESLLLENAKSNYDVFVASYAQKQTERKYKHIKFHIFLSYASGQQNDAESIYYSLLNNGHMVFFDRDSLPKGMEYNTAIHDAIYCSDMMIFLISPDSVGAGHYTLSELKFARERWASANGNLLPVMVIETPYDNIPAYAKSVTIFKPEGNLVAELTAEIERMYAGRKR